MSKKMVSYPLDWGIWCFKEAAHFLLTSSFCFSLIFSINLETLLYQIIKHVSMSGNNCLLRCYKEGAGGGGKIDFTKCFCAKNALCMLLVEIMQKSWKNSKFMPPLIIRGEFLNWLKKALFFTLFLYFFHFIRRFDTWIFCKSYFFYNKVSHILGSRQILSSLHSI